MGRRPPAARLTAMLGVLVLALGGIGVRLILLQVRDTQIYEELARDQRVREVELPATRGSILDRNRNALAISREARALYADPELIQEPKALAADLAPVLGVRPWVVTKALGDDSSFVYLARRLDLGAAGRIERMNVPGIGFLEESRRDYPAGELAPQAVGFVGVDNVGLSGIELQFEDVLAGSPGRLILEQDPAGRTIPSAAVSGEEPVAGRDLVLTIDRDLQFQTQRALAAAVRANGARGGTVVVLDARTGDVLTMVTYPWFDLNEFGKAPAGVVRNRAVTDVYEPGSVNKVITAAAALEERVIRPWERIDVPDSYVVGDKEFRDLEPHGVQAMTLSDIMTASSNVGTIKVAERLGKDRLASYLTRFGFGRKTGIDFPGESAGILLPRDQWWVTSMGTIPLGQGIAVTPLQMAAVYATIANGGVWVQPRFALGTLDEEGNLEPMPAGERRRVVSRSTARQVGRMLVRVVEEGTGQLARVPGYRVGGKTGTARKPLQDALGYSDEFVASFIGFAPAEDPRIVVAAIIDEPDTVYGGVAAAPLFRDVVRFAMADMRVPPRAGA